MTSTDEQELQRFFERRLTPVAEQLRARGRALFPLGPDEGAGSWYVDCDPDSPEFFEVETTSLESDLRTMWERQELPELAALARELAGLAEQVRLNSAESDEVSPFMYVMY